MSEELSFPELIRRVRAGDHEAAAELVQRYQAPLRAMVRVRLGSTGLGRRVDTSDICQSVLGSFFVRAALGQYELAEPDQLLKLLTAMARNKMASEARKQLAGRRDQRRVSALDPELNPVAARDATPSRAMAMKELLAEVERRLSPEERQLAELRQQGLDWDAIAEQVGGNAVALRKKFSRAVARITEELGLDEVGHA